MSDIFSQWREMRGDTDPDDPPTCPYCGDDEIAANTPPPGYALACENCDREWRSLAELDAEAREMVRLDEWMMRQP